MHKRQGKLLRIAIANPVTAPYGVAAVSVMQALGVYKALRPHLVRGMNIAQTYQFAFTGNASLGFVALSQIAGRTGGSHWLVPTDLHSAIAQDAVLLRHGAQNVAAHAFLAFLKGNDARRVSEMFGYTTVLRGMTQGRASMTMEPSEYRPMPPNLTQEVLAQA